MTLKQIIEIADDAYPDGMVADYFRAPDEDHGDTLAQFIAIELKETYDPNGSDAEQLVAAAKAMRTALSELQEVTDAFERRLYE